MLELEKIPFYKIELLEVYVFMNDAVRILVFNIRELRMRSEIYTLPHR